MKDDNIEFTGELCGERRMEWFPYRGKVSWKCRGRLKKRVDLRLIYCEDCFTGLDGFDPFRSGEPSDLQNHDVAGSIPVRVLK